MDDTKAPLPPTPPRDDVDNRGVLLFGLGLGLAMLVILGSIWVFFRVLEKRQERSDRLIEPQVAASFRRTPPEPRLEPQPLAPRLALRAQEDGQLSSYGWIDRGSGLVHIPIDRAMEIVAERGVPGGKPFPVGPAAAPTPTAGTKR